MITKAELENIVEEGAEKHALANTPVSFNPEVIQYTEEYRHYMDIYWMKLGVFKSGASFVTGILMAEIERVENNCDTLENKAIFWMETNDRAIEHTESLQLTITTLKTEIQSLKDENKRMKEVIKCCDSDYWFMINLIEHYSTNKDDALKDCLERMKFRKPMFKTALTKARGRNEPKNAIQVIY